MLTYRRRTQVSSWLKKELKRANKENKRCKKLYSDWKNDEFNCGANKFIFGVISDVSKYLDAVGNSEPSFQTLNDLQVYYNRDNKKYFLDIEVGFNGTDDITYLNNLLNKFKSFISLEYNINKVTTLLDTNLYKYMQDLQDDYWSAHDLITLYGKFNIFVNGYKKLCADKKRVEVIENKQIK